MKNIIVLFILMLPIIGFSQEPCLFICKSESEMRQAADAIALKAKSNFVFRDITRSPRAEAKVSVRYWDTANVERRKMSVVFEEYMIGKNEDLEIPGTPVYYLYSVSGKYLDLFPTWKAYIDPTAELEKTSIHYYNESKLQCNGENLEFRFDKLTDTWKLYLIRM